MGAACDVAALGLGLAVAAALLACHRCAVQTQTPPGGSGCMPELVSLSPCMDYMSGNATAPGAPCCTALSGVLRSNPRCLCMVLGGTAASLGVAVDSGLAQQLPGACKVQTPPASQCNSVGVPVPSPANPTTPGSTPATPSEPNVSPYPSITKTHQVTGDKSQMDQQGQETQPAAGKAAEVTLRRFDLDDVDAMMAWASDPQVAAVCRWEPYESTEPLLAFIRDTVLPHPWFRAICLSGGEGEGRPVGAVSVTPTADACRAELGYVLARAHWGKGVATAAVKRVVATVFAEVEGLERVEALVDVRNAASQRVLEKAGFRREGVLRRYCVLKGAVNDTAIYSFISTDPLVE